MYIYCFDPSRSSGFRPYWLFNKLAKISQLRNKEMNEKGARVIRVLGSSWYSREAAIFLSHPMMISDYWSWLEFSLSSWRKAVKIHNERLSKGRSLNQTVDFGSDSLQLPGPHILKQKWQVTLWGDKNGTFRVFELEDLREHQFASCLCQQQGNWDLKVLSDVPNCHTDN